MVKPGRSFLHRLFELQAATKKLHHHIPLRGTVKSDLAWWDTFLESWNGVAIIPPTIPVAPPHQVYTDVAGGFGCGAIWGRHWFQYMWPSAFQGRAIATQELLPIVMVCMIWGPWWANNRVVVHCDNQAAVCVVNAGYSHDKDMMHLMHCLFFIRAYWGIDLWAVHIPGEQNVAADAISHGNLSTLFQVSPQVSPLPTVVPQSLHDLLVVQQLDWTSPSWVSLFRSCLRQVWQTPPKKPTSQVNGAMQNSAPGQVLPHFQPRRQPFLPS